ncbi:MAG: aldehyde ferredoxin oxidoreductase family protein [Defluviitaleaceae bacterium]|nr:aldehyde ferredoxin oxidoreductase family protein [Defluviitaleaceae bacterium]
MPQRDELFKYLGGKGLAAKIIYDAFDKRIEAFSDENLIVITTAPFNGSTAPSSSRFNISTISPLTGLLVSSNCGGDFGINLRRAGYDALVISGRATEKIYIRVGEDGIKLRDASDIWGRSTTEAQVTMGAGGKLAIGVAGENLVRYACVASQERMVGRGGVGAVFGYKQLKGIVVSGKAPIVTLYDKESLKEFNKKWIAKLRNHPITGQQLPNLGTSALVRPMQSYSMLATRNFSGGRFDGFEALSGETLREKHLIKNKGCMTCPIQCGRVVSLDERVIKGPELETIGLLGSNLLNDDMTLIMRLNHLCDEYGIDTISFGSSVGFAMELNEKGLWDNDLQFGDCEKLLALVTLVAYREGIGADIGDGVMRMSEKYGGGEFAIHVKGMELAAYNPRAVQGMGIGYATANRGGCHLNGGYLVVLEGLGMHINGATTRGKSALTIFFQDLMEAASAAGSCLFTTYAVLPSALIKYPDNVFVRLIYSLLPGLGGIFAFAHNHPGILGVNVPSLVPHSYAYKLVTGTNMNIGRFMRSGERIFNLERLINIRQGLVDGDTLPKRLTTDQQESDGSVQGGVQLEKMLKKYYKIRGWDKHGAPKQKRLKKLGLDAL